jgi:trigger factor
MEDYRKGLVEQATEQVKSQLVIGKIIEEEKIEATEEDVEARVNEMAKNQNRPAPDVKKHINSRQLDYMKNEIIIKKLFDLLKSANTIK